MYGCESCGTTQAAIHRTSPKGENFRGKCAACLGQPRPSDTFADRLLDAMTPIETSVEEV